MFDVIMLVVDFVFAHCSQTEMKCPAEDARHYLSQTAWNLVAALAAYQADMSDTARQRHHAEIPRGIAEIDDDIHVIIEPRAYRYFHICDLHYVHLI